MIMKTTVLRSAALACALTAVACGRTPLDVQGPDEVSATSTGTTTTSESASGSGGWGGSPTSGPGTSTSSAGGQGNGGQGGQGGRGAGAFSAQCTGVLDCPSLDGCAGWDYVIDDGGASTHVIAAVTILQPAPLPSCTTDVTFDDVGGAPPTDVVNIPCGTQTWSLGIDRTTLTVYVNVNPLGLSWTPPCQ